MIGDLSQARAESGPVVAVSPWVLVVFALAVLVLVSVNSWAKHRGSRAARDRSFARSRRYPS